MAEEGFEEVSCNLCGGRSYEVVLRPTLTEQDISSHATRAVPTDAGIKTARIVRCRHCGLCYANPRPRAELLRCWYGEMSDPSFLAEMPYKIRSASYYLQRLRSLSSGTNLLEVGCYTGFFLKAARDVGWRVQGVEPSEWAASFARQTLYLPVTTGTLEETPFEASSFDVVTLFQVLEHVGDPKRFLERVHALLAKGGVVVIEVPDIESLAARLLKTRWWLLKPVHLYYFSAKTLSAYLEKAGFQVLWRGNAVNTFSLGHLARRLHPYLGKPSTFLSRALDFLHLGRVGVSLNLRDLLLIYAKKAP